MSCFPVEPGPSPSQSQHWAASLGKGKEDESMRGGGGVAGVWVWMERGVEVVENCGHDCSNPVISRTKAGHSSDLKTQMLSCLCLSSLLLLLFSVPLALSHSLLPASLNVRGWSWLCLTLNSQSSHTPQAIFNSVRTKGFFFPAVLGLLAHLMHLNVSTVVKGHDVHKNGSSHLRWMERQF